MCCRRLMSRWSGVLRNCRSGGVCCRQSRNAGCRTVVSAGRRVRRRARFRLQRGRRSRGLLNRLSCCRRQARCCGNRRMWCCWFRNPCWVERPMRLWSRHWRRGAGGSSRILGWRSCGNGCGGCRGQGRKSRGLPWRGLLQPQRLCIRWSLLRARRCGCSVWMACCGYCCVCEWCLGPVLRVTGCRSGWI